MFGRNLDLKINTQKKQNKTKQNKKEKEKFYSKNVCRKEPPCNTIVGLGCNPLTDPLKKNLY